MTEKGIWGTGIAALAAIAFFCVWHHKPSDLAAVPVKELAPVVKPAVPAAPVEAPPVAVPAAAPVAELPAPAPIAAIAPPSKAQVIAPEVASVPAVGKPTAKRLYAGSARKPSMTAKRLTKPKTKYYKRAARGCELNEGRTSSGVIRSVCFNFNSAKLSARSKAKLDAIVPNLKADAKSYELGGFTDVIGSKNYNSNLAERRAQAVKRYLESKGVDAGKVVVKSYGSEPSTTSGSKPSTPSQDRRVDVKVL